MAGGLDEPAEEREGFLGSGASASSAIANDPERDTMPTKGGGNSSNSSSAANMRARSRRRGREECLADQLLESPNGMKRDGNRAESATPGSRTRSTFESKTVAIAPRGLASSSSPRLLAFVEAFLCGPENTRIGLAVLAAAMLLSLTMAVAASMGLWSWSDIFPRKAYLFDVVRDCRVVRSGRGAACSNVFESLCFDRSRCSGADGGAAGGTSLSVYVHDDECSMKTSSEIVGGYRGSANPKMWSQAANALRQVAAARGLLVETPQEACVIVYGVPHEKECVSRTPTWEEGKNHLLLDMNDASRDAYPTLDDKAMFAEANMRPCYFRYGYDIAIPLRARALFYNLKGIAPQDRKYFATFKGSLYLSGNGLRERTAALTAAETAADPSGVVVVEICDRFNGEPQRPRNLKRCQRLQREYDSTDYGDLMNTTFALVPAGRSPATYRLGEALSAGAIPVFIHQDFVKPFPGRIPWNTFSFSFPAEEAPRIIDTLRTVSPRQLAKMQVTALEVFDKYFGRGMNGIVGTTLDILEERLAFRGQRR